MMFRSQFSRFSAGLFFLYWVSPLFFYSFNAKALTPGTHSALEATPTATESNPAVSKTQKPKNVKKKATTTAKGGGTIKSTPAKSANANENSLLKALEAKYKQEPAFTANFSQKVKTPTSQREKLSKGTLQILSPGKIRWEIQTPDPQLIVSDGKIFWHYTPPFEPTDRGQVIVKKASEFKTPVLDALLAGRFSNSNNLSIRSTGPRTFLLTPKKRGALSIKKIEVILHPTELALQTIALDYVDGNHTEISLSEVKFSHSLAPEVFDFKIPERTDVVNP